MIEKYWNEMFKEFIVDNNKFFIENFPEPLISAHFGVQNIVAETKENAKFRYMLCCFRPLGEKVETRAKIETLECAINSDEFWNFHTRENNDSLIFMRKFLPFLVESKMPHWHFYIEENGKILGSIIVGVTSEVILGFNALVGKQARNKGVAAELSKAARSHFCNHEFFYWTKHSWLKNDCDTALEYSIV